jgi:hypothetical protein
VAILTTRDGSSHARRTGLVRRRDRAWSVTSQRHTNPHDVEVVIVSPHLQLEVHG